LLLSVVCVQAADLDSALKAANALQSTGGQLDRTHYTNLIKAAAAAADADAAFKLYRHASPPPPQVRWLMAPDIRCQIKEP
jgi:hypothetical protein